jgi:hypothetical protein
VNYVYSVSTSNLGLRRHLEQYHSKDYVAVCKEKGWDIMIDSLQPKAQKQKSLDAHLQDTSQK